MSLTNYYTLGITPVQQTTEKNMIYHSNDNISAIDAKSTITNSDSTKLTNTHTIPVSVDITSASSTENSVVSDYSIKTNENEIHPIDSTTTVDMSPITVPSENATLSTSCIPSETTYNSKSGTLDVLFPVYLNNDTNTQLDTDDSDSDSDWSCVIS